ncbi:uncharacterized protein LOC124441542 [Xenia sp. Carnegie-2017]|uniref:uncharacterized protein LOC124441542 n=1 Tax=Xenia sp. Carnegie-2017 TaxID=2897299 RepID=UPI001F036F9B|nr:uncharacterized protein LOC124441542 [Xenia sp. Carnegie-2017]
MDVNFQRINSAYLGAKSLKLAVQKSVKESILLEHVFKLFSIISFDPLPQDIIIKFIRSIDPQKSAEDVCLHLKQCSIFLQSKNNDIRLHSVVHEAIINYHEENIFAISSADLACHVAWALYHFEDREDEIKIIPHLIKFIKNLSSEQFLNKLIDVKSLKQKLNEKNWKIANYFVAALERFCYYKQATKVLYEITEIQTKVLGVDHIDVSFSYNKLGVLLWKNGEYKKAKDLYEQAMKIQTKAFGPDHVDVVKIYHNLGAVYRDMGEYGRLRKSKRFL